MALGNPTDDIILKIKAEKEDASKSVKSLREELRAAVQEGVAISRQFGENSKEASKAASKVANLRDEMDDFNQKVKALNPDKFARFATATTGVVNGFQAAQGAAVLFGAESEDLQKTMVKLQAVMAFSQGIQGVLDAKKAFGGLGTTIKTSVVQAFTTLKGAIIATGIGALVVGVGLLIANFDKVKQVILNTFPGLAGLGKAIGKVVDSVTDLLGLTSAATREQDEIMDKLERDIKRQEGFLDRNKDSLDKHLLAKKEALLDYNKKVLAVEEKFAEDKNSAERKRALDELKAQNNRMNTKAEQEKQLEAQTNRQKIADAQKAIADKAQAERDKLAEELKKKIEDELNEETRVRDLRAKARLQERIEKARELLDKAEMDRKEKDQVQAGITALEKINTEYWAKKNAENDANAALEREILYSGTASLLNSLQELNAAFAGKTEAQQKKAFQRNKALAIADTIISTYSAAQKAFESGMSTIGPWAPAIAAAYAGVAIAAGLARIATISKTKFQGSGGDVASNPGGGGDKGGGGIQAAATGFSFVKAPSQDKGSQTGDPKPIKVFVVSKDMKDAFGRDDSIQSKAVVK